MELSTINSAVPAGRVVAILLWLLFARVAAAGETRPCAPPPIHPIASSVPQTLHLSAAEASQWANQPCIRWDAHHLSSFDMIVGSYPGSDLISALSRLVDQSKIKGMRYWSVTDGRLEPLVIDAFALESPVLGGHRRPDYHPSEIAEMRAGDSVYFEEIDNRSSEGVQYRLTILEWDAVQIVVEIANRSPVRLHGLTLYAPEALRTAIYISPQSNGTLTCYGILGSDLSPIARLLPSRKSQLNRLIALYGYITNSDDQHLPWAY